MKRVLRNLLLAAAFWQASASAAEPAEDVEVSVSIPVSSDIDTELLADCVAQQAADIPAPDDEYDQSAYLNVVVDTFFPQAEIFGVKLVNGRPTEVRLDVTNNEPEPIKLAVVGGVLTTPPGAPGQPDPPRIIRNLTRMSYDISVQAGANHSFAYIFENDMAPQDIHLRVAAFFVNSKEQLFTHYAFDAPVSIVEAPISFLDPQVLFLYLFLIAVFGGTVYFVYQTWVTRLFPQKRRGGKGGQRAKRSSGGSKKVNPSDQVSVIGADGPAVTTGAKAYDESWIPAEHLKRPEARRVGSGKPKSKAA